MEITLCLIVKNEEDTLDRCLKCASRFVDEIVIVDTGSIDKTKEIAKQYNANIYDFKWCDDFGKARNFAFSKGTKEYLMWLDADDYITEENINKLIELKKILDPSVDSVSLIYSLGRDNDGNTITSLRRNRIVKKSSNFKWIGKIHEYLEVYGNIINEDIYIHHGKQKSHTDRNLQIFERMKEEGTNFTVRDMFYYSNELYYNGLYKEAIIEYNSFLKKDGWIEDKKTAVSNLAACYEILNQPENMVSCVLESLKWSKPRADICCKLASYFFNTNSYLDAIFWYKACLNCIPEKDSLGLDYKDYYTWIPAIQLSVCYSKIGDFQSSYYYNELCDHFSGPTAKTAHNRRYLSNELSKKGIPIPHYTISLTNSDTK